MADNFQPANQVTVERYKAVRSLERSNRVDEFVRPDWALQHARRDYNIPRPLAMKSCCRRA